MSWVRWPIAVAAICVAGSSAAQAEPDTNLVPDPSFEAPTPPWFADHPGVFADKRSVSGAADGARVLDIEGWDGTATIASPPLTLERGPARGSFDARSFGPATGGEVELALYDVQKKVKLATLGTLSLDGSGQWATSRGVPATIADGTKAVLALLVRGPSRGVRVEADRVVLRAGRGPSPRFTDPTFVQSFEAEDMTLAGEGWAPRSHFENWYEGYPSRMKMLGGASGVAAAENLPATWRTEVPRAGRYVLWTRFLHTTSRLAGRFTVSVRQAGRPPQAREIDDSAPEYVPVAREQALGWAFAPMEVELSSGPVDIELTRPPDAVWGGGREVDMFVLTNLAYYRPKIEDFRPQGYVRFVNAGASSLCLWQTVLRLHTPRFGPSSAMLTRAGLVPGSCTEGRRIEAGEASPWEHLSDLLTAGGPGNGVAFIATRGTATEGLVTDGLDGAFEFALGDGGQVIKRVPVHQGKPRSLFMIDADFTPESIRVAADYLAKEEAAAGSFSEARRPRAYHLDLSLELWGLDPKLDPPELVDREFGVASDLGFDGTYTPIGDPRDVKAFYAARGMNHLGVWGAPLAYGSGDQLDVHLAEMKAEWSRLAARYAPILDMIEHVKIADEPGAMSYAALAASTRAQSDFPRWLGAQGLSPSELGLASWDEAKPVVPSDAAKAPRLFYWTGLYRLAVFSRLAHLAVDAKRAAGFPERARTYVCYVPTWDGTSFTSRGVDPFLVQRDGGLELGWTEDWLGYGVGPEHISDQLAVLRAAGAPERQPLGLYVVGVDGPPELQRLRYFEALAAGARHFAEYNYGPYYDSIDSWGARYEVYRPLADTLHDLGAIDAALEGTERRSSDVAILYNRADAIWAGEDTTLEQDGRYMFWALAHAGYQPDYLPEEDVLSGALRRYRVLYLTGVHLRRAVARAIADWVARGGVLFASAGAGTRDEYDSPLDSLDEVFGASGGRFERVAPAGRPKYELRSLASLGDLTVKGTDLPPAVFERLSVRETLLPRADAEVIVRDETGAPAGVRHRFGKGLAIRVAALPGVAYVHDAVQGPSYDPEGYRPTAFRPSLRDFIAFAARVAGARHAELAAPAAEVASFDAADRTVAVVVNHGPVLQTFAMVLDGVPVGSAYTASGAPVTVTALGPRRARVQFALRDADAVVLLPAASGSWPARPSAVRPPPAGCACRAAPSGRRGGALASAVAALLGAAWWTRRDRAARRNQAS